MSGLGLVASTAAGPLSAALMLKNPWIPFLMSTPGIVIVVALLTLLPHIERPKQEEPVKSSNMIEVSDMKGRIMDAARTTSAFVRKNVAVMILVCPYAISMFHLHPFLLIFISKRFDTSFANVSCTPHLGKTRTNFFAGYFPCDHSRRCLDRSHPLPHPTHQSTAREQNVHVPIHQRSKDHTDLCSPFDCWYAWRGSGSEYTLSS